MEFVAGLFIGLAVGATIGIVATVWFFIKESQ